jgi:hypothetical protein
MTKYERKMNRDVRTIRSVSRIDDVALKKPLATCSRLTNHALAILTHIDSAWVAYKVEPRASRSNPFGPVRIWIIALSAGLVRA